VEPSSNTADAAKVEQFTSLLATCQRPVFLYAMSLLFDAADAEDVLQETNLVLWRKFDQYRPGTSFVRWACRTAYYEVLKVRRAQSRERRVFSEEMLAILAAESEKSLELADTRRRVLNHCLEKLSEADRELIFRRYQKDATTMTVASALGRSVQGTRRALHRIRQALLVCVQRTTAAEEGA
jgi:RNA polymerase sigma-70 factor, ECF subfamily